MHNAKHAKQLYTAPAYDIGFLAITKCGSTFLKNLFWQLHFGERHPEADRIHAHDDAMPRGDTLTHEDITAGDAYFVVLRHPVARFLSVYFDKFQEPLRPSAPTNVFRRIIGDEPRFNWTAQTAEQHIANLNIAIDALEVSLSSVSKRLKNPHWAPQARRVDRFAKPMRLAALTVENLDQQLITLLGPKVPDIADFIAAVKARNSGKTKPKQQLVDAELERRILQLYAQDFEIWSEISDGWARCQGRDTIPRFQG